MQYADSSTLFKPNPPVGVTPLQVTCWVNFWDRSIWYFDSLGMCKAEVLDALLTWVTCLRDHWPPYKKRRGTPFKPWAPQGHASHGRLPPETYAVRCSTVAQFYIGSRLVLWVWLVACGAGRRHIYVIVQAGCCAGQV